MFGNFVGRAPGPGTRIVEVNTRPQRRTPRRDFMPGADVRHVVDLSALYPRRNRLGALFAAGPAVCRRLGTSVLHTAMGVRIAQLVPAGLWDTVDTARRNQDHIQRALSPVVAQTDSVLPRKLRRKMFWARVAERAIGIVQAQPIAPGSPTEDIFGAYVSRLFPEFEGVDQLSPEGGPVADNGGWRAADGGSGAGLIGTDGRTDLLAPHD